MQLIAINDCSKATLQSSMISEFFPFDKYKEREEG